MTRFLALLALLLAPALALADPLPTGKPDSAIAAPTLPKADAAVAPVAAPTITTTVATSTTTTKPALPGVDTDPAGYVSAAQRAADEHQWALLISLLLAGLAFAARRFLPGIAWVQSRVGTLVLPLAAGLAAASERLYQGAHAGSVIVAGVVTALLAAGAMINPKKPEANGTKLSIPDSHFGGWLLPLLFCVPFIYGCHNPIDVARQSLAATERAISASTTSLQAYDLTAQEQILAANPDPAAARAAIDAYRAKRATVVKVIADAAAVCAVGHPLIDAVEAGVKKQTDLSAWMATLLDLATQMMAALKAFGVPLPAVLGVAPIRVPDVRSTWALSYSYPVWR